MKVRLYILQSLKVGDVIFIPDNKIHYIQNVLKLKTSFKVFIFNEEDGEFEGMILQHEKTPKIKIIQPVSSPTQSCKIKINLVFANIKNNLTSDVLNACTQIGIDGFYPIITQRTTNHHFSLDRAKKIVEEAIEQCGRTSVPHINPLLKFADIFDTIKENDTIIFCDEKPNYNQNEFKTNNVGERIFIFIGPEGGFNEEERNLLYSKNPYTFNLGKFILRAENASICASFLASYILNNVK
jgi:16S rRNA (uracil1498-N3)-methyltransferase